MKKTLKWSLVMMLAVIGLTFTSCDDDDDTPKVPTVEEVVGDYSGKMNYAAVKETAETGTDLSLKVEKDSISFEEFPYEGLVKTIIQNEDQANGIIEQVGKLSYKVAYKAAMNAANDSISLTLDPKPLKISVEGLEVDVTITAEEKGSFAIEKNNLKFSLTATEAKLGEANVLEAPIKLSFDMTKKK